MKIIALGASASQRSINRQLASYTAHRFGGSEVEVLDLNDFEAPLYTIDKENAQGIPDVIKRFDNKLQSGDILIISLAEHNGTYTVAFKNIFDWLSRYNSKMFTGKKMILLSTATGKRGGLGVMEAAQIRFPKHGADIIGSFSLPLFRETFDPNTGIIDEDLKEEFDGFLAEMKEKVAAVETV